MMLIYVSPITYKLCTQIVHVTKNPKLGSQGMSSSSPLTVKRSQVVIVKPSNATPDVSLSLSTLDNDPNLESLAKTIYVYAPPSSKADVHDPASLFQQALAHALVYYYPLAGKLHRGSHDHRLELRCSPAEGVPFVRATADCTLSSLNYLEDTDADLYQLVPSDVAVRSGGYNPLALQITLFACGGITFAAALSHSLCDGFGASQFFKALTELAEGKKQPSIIPVWDRHCLTPNNFSVTGQVEQGQAPKLVNFEEACSPVAISPYTPSNDMVCEILNVTSEEITQLKEKVEGEVTTLEILAAHVWRSRCRALKLNLDGTSQFGMAVGIRRIVDPPLPEGYYGNAFVMANIVMKVSELNNSPLSHVVTLIKEAKRAALEKSYVSEQLRKIERKLKMKVACEGGNGALFLLTDWRHLGLLNKVDFGYGGSLSIIPLVSDICIFLPRKHGGVRVQITLPKPAMDNFKEHMINTLCL
ncbi:PREDICTED: spermidine sinapoyl-CoA acyltransferase-like [Camelina sativa]|uniref:Spermidine sinapoyl-CoA acyltransferase-like n=1 Tax=Camelina sativa TaxID=90675 RepID=A0ABM0V8T6_CAMSA|nr:PREDICTED: spermidine sinapoyl-CoA acyltransferase-like [Camelina sativa]